MSTKVVKLDAYSLIRISGEERITFLQGQLTQDLDCVTEKSSALAGWASAKGRLLMVAQLLAWRDSIYLAVPTETAAGLVQRFRMYVLRAKVDVELSDLAVFGLFDLNATSAVTIGKLSLNNEPGAVASSDKVLMARIIGDSSRAFLIGEIQHINSIGQLEQIDQAGDPLWKLQNIRNGLPIIYSDISESFVPQMLNLDLLGGISFSKGCYLGQEIVARAQNLGRIKRRMYYFCADNKQSVSSGTNLYGPNNISGKIVAVAANGSGVDLLAVIPIDESAGQWFADEERTRPVENRGLPYTIPN